jgi:predicted TIM-barrel fold metal-dependent hydrolase
MSFVDCDVHNALPSPGVLKKHLPAEWHEEWDRGRGPGGVTGGGLYPSRPQKGFLRADAMPPSGGPAGSSYEFMKEQYLDAWPVRAALLAPLDANGWTQSGPFGAAVNSAMNDWLVEEWLWRDDRLYAAIGIPTEDGIRAAKEIRRMAGHDRFVQVMMYSRTRDPLGNAKYWPIFEAATEAHLPIAMHVGGLGNPMTGSGWPSYHFEYHASFVHTFQAQIVSLVASGVFKELPDLRFVMEEGGFVWLAPLLWRLDRAWRLMNPFAAAERAPSEIVRRHFWFTTQPIDEAERPEQFVQMLGHLDHLGLLERIMFSTDYPHWDFDSPEQAFPAVVSGDVKERIFHRNAESLYGFKGRVLDA